MVWNTAQLNTKDKPPVTPNAKTLKEPRKQDNQTQTLRRDTNPLGLEMMGF